MLPKEPVIAREDQSSNSRLVCCPAIISSMRHIGYIFPLIFGILLACQLISQPITQWSQVGSPTPFSVLSPGSDGTPSFPSVASPQTTRFMTPSPEANIAYLQGEDGFTVRFHPDGELYVGDRISLEIIPPPAISLEGRQVLVQVGGAWPSTLSSVGFEPFGISGRVQATMLWEWDTSELEVGTYTLTFTLQPDDYVWEETIVLNPESDLPPSQRQASWAATESDCCNIYYITNTAVERDLESLLAIVDEQALRASQSLNSEFVEPVSVVFIPRVLGHGGFASNEVSISYLDRNYAFSDVQTVLNHEFVHILDNRLGGELRPTLLVEGLAVYLSGGHFKQEDLVPRAAALLELGWYLPLEDLMEDFYLSQHETGYLEAGALVAYMVESRGWDTFSNFYRDIHPTKSGRQTDAVRQALRAHFGLSLAELERGFVEFLQSQEVSSKEREDVRLTVIFYDTVRRYQQMHDPSAYFLTAWMLDAQQMRQKGIVADYLRRPSAVENIALEAMLVSVGRQLQQRDYAGIEDTLMAVNSVLDGIQQGVVDSFSLHPLAGDFFAITTVVRREGWHLQRIEIEENIARVWVSDSKPELSEVLLVRAADEWRIYAVAQ